MRLAKMLALTVIAGIMGAAGRLRSAISRVFMDEPAAPMLDLAVVGAGVAGAYVAYAVSRARADWSLALFERSARIGGRLRSLRPAGFTGHPIELGGMSYHTGQPIVTGLVESLGLAARPLPLVHDEDRYHLRDHVATAADEGRAGAGYELAARERGRSAAQLLSMALERIVPGFAELDLGDWAVTSRELRYRGRPLHEWSIGDALASALSPEAHRLIAEAIGYDSAARACNAADAIPYLVGGKPPSAERRTLIDGMDRLPRELAARFQAAGGAIRLKHDLAGMTVEPGSGGAAVFHLRFAGGEVVRATRVVLAMPSPALTALAEGAPVLARPDVLRLIASVEPIPAAKLYLWYDRPWWRDTGFAGLRITTDRPNRKVFYFDPEITGAGPAVLLAAYTDGMDMAPWRALAGGGTVTPSASPAMLEAVRRELRLLHGSDGDAIPEPVGSAYVDWGADPRECGWHFWRPGARSREILSRIVKPEPALELFICGEAYSTSQALVEGALASAATVVRAVTGRCSGADRQCSDADRQCSGGVRG
jgi:lysine 2-monooxygenase